MKSLEEKLDALTTKIVALEVTEAKDIQHIKELSDLRNEGLSKALELQHTETERRLDNLNHEAAQLKDIQATYLPREVWENAIKDTHKDLTELKTYKDNSIGRNSVIAIVISIIVSLIFVIINYFLSHIK
jgi:hypothetical protein